jgi:hypothetical protein
MNEALNTNVAPPAADEPPQVPLAMNQFQAHCKYVESKVLETSRAAQSKHGPRITNPKLHPAT